MSEDSKSYVKLLAETEEGFLAYEREGLLKFPEASINSPSERFKKAKEICKDLSAEDPDISDIVKLEIQSGNKNTYYYLYCKLKSVDSKENYQTVNKDDFFKHNWHISDQYAYSPIKHLDEYLKEDHNYNQGKKIDVAKVVLRNKEGEFLLTKKSHLEKVTSEGSFKKYGKMSGKWELPGGRIGKVEGEDRFQAAKRETKEETNLDLSDGVDIVRIQVEEENRVNCYIILFEKWKGELKLSEEHIDSKWTNEDSLDNLEFHKDSAYILPPLKNLEHYQKQAKNYEE